ncbi:hypothetical protein HAX54_047954, partial [Datura stramonium]|nr:hypothetical protein [Datura stramonium]
FWSNGKRRLFGGLPVEREDEEETERGGDRVVVFAGWRREVIFRWIWPEKTKMVWRLVLVFRPTVTGIIGGNDGACMQLWRWHGWYLVGVNGGIERGRESG